MLFEISYPAILARDPYPLFLHNFKGHPLEVYIFRVFFS